MATQIEKIVNILISGGCVQVPDNLKKEVTAKLRDIKKNCTIVLSQFKNN